MPRRLHSKMIVLSSSSLRTSRKALNLCVVSDEKLPFSTNKGLRPRYDFYQQLVGGGGEHTQTSLSGLVHTYSAAVLVWRTVVSGNHVHAVFTVSAPP